MNQNELFTIRYAPGNNNNGDGVSQAINRMSEDHRNCNMAAILAKDLTDVLNFCLERNTAIHMQHSQDFNEDMAISAVINTMIGLSKVTVEQAGSDIDKIGFLPKKFDTKPNFQLLEFDMRTKDNKTILYNAYIPCLHTESACNECVSKGLACKNRMKEFITNLYC